MSWFLFTYDNIMLSTRKVKYCGAMSTLHIWGYVSTSGYHFVINSSYGTTTESTEIAWSNHYPIGQQQPADVSVSTNPCESSSQS